MKSGSYGNRTGIHAPASGILAQSPAQSWSKLIKLMWIVYILECSDQTLYTGVTTDLERRLAEHNGDLAGGARYTRSRRPVSLLYSEETENRSLASKREHQIKAMSRRQKLALTQADE